MKRFTTMAGAVALALTLNAGLASAKGANPNKPAKAGGAKGQKGAGAMQQQFKRIEDVLGKPLTEEQKTAITDSFKTYQESVAKTLGLTLDDWNAKQKEYREQHKAGGAKAGATAPTTKPATP